MLAAPAVAVVNDLGLDFISKIVSLHPCPSLGKSRDISKGQSQALFFLVVLRVEYVRILFWKRI